MNITQVEYNSLSNERILEKKIIANGITRKSSLYKNIPLILLLFFISIFSVIILYGYLNIAKQNRKINTLNSEILSLKTEKDSYNIKLEPYKSVDRIKKLAKLNYNMDFPKKEQIKYVDKLK